MTGIVVPYPTLSEIGKRAAISYFSPSLNESKGAAPDRLPAPVRLSYTDAGKA